MKKLDEAIVYIKIYELKAKKIKDIQLVKDSKVDKPTSIIICQVDHDNKDLNEYLEELEQLTKDKND